MAKTQLKQKANKKELVSKKKRMSVSEFKNSWNRLFSLFEGQKKVFWWTIVLSFIEAVMAIVVTFIICYVYDHYLMSKDAQQAAEILTKGWFQFVMLCVAIILIYTVSQISFLLHSIWMSKVSERILYGLRRDTLNKLHLLPIKFFDVMPSGEIMTRMSSDVDNISQLTSQYLSSTFYYGLLIFVGFISMFLINWFLSLVTMIAIPLMVVGNYVIVKRVQPSFVRQQNSISKLNGYTEEMVSGTKVISIFNMQEKCLKDFDLVNKDLTKNSIFAQTSQNLMMPLNNFLTRLAMFIICALGMGLILYFMDSNPETAKFLYKASPLSFLNFENPSTLLIAFTMFSRIFTESFNSLISSFSYVFYALAGSNRVFEILDAKEEKDLPSAKPIQNIKGKVEAKHLDFGYVKNHLVLRDLNFVAQPGQMIAIVGPTGSGKTTIVNLITKFYDLNAGDLLIDGKSISQITRKSLRQNIAIILQDTFLFAESVKENIRYGRLDATDEEIIAAAKEAHLHEFIMRLPQGYDTILHDNGSDLSAGQRQLLTIARAFLAKPKIVILDEATSSIDTKTELVLQNAMIKLMKGKTSFVVAHRLSTIANADKILVLKEGHIVEEGKHKELLKKKGFYAKLYDAQFKKGQAL